MKTIYWCFPAGRHKALLLSYDDGKMADHRLVETLNRHGLRGTFHLNAGKFGRDGRVARAEAATLYAGHEISAHSYTHPTLTRMPREAVLSQLLEDRRALESITGCPVRGMSYPNGAVDVNLAALLPQLGLEYGRTTETNGRFGLPENLLRWPATCHHNDRLLERAGEFNALNKQHMLYLFHVWGHSYEFDNDNNWEVIEAFAAEMGGRPEIWYATHIDLVDYLCAARALQFTVNCDKVKNPSAIPVSISVDGQCVEVAPGALLTLV